MSCKGCPLKGRPFVPGIGTGATMIIGEAPGESEAERSMPFVGPAGRFLDELLQSVGIVRGSCRITNAVKCWPENNRTPTKKALECCKEFVEKELAQHKPTLVIALGRIALKLFDDTPLASCHGMKLQKEGFILIPMYHPAAALHNPAMRPTIEADFRKMGEKSASQPIRGNYKVGEPQETKDVLGRPAKPTRMFTIPRFPAAIDCETTGIERDAELLGVGISWQPGTAIYMIPEVAYATLTNQRIPNVIMHNAKYDLQVLANHRIPIRELGLVDDTMILAYCMNLEPLGLKDLALRELGVQMKRYEDIVLKGGTLKDVPVEEVAQYCGADVDATLRLWPHLSGKASKRELDLYNKIDRPLMVVLTRMEMGGIHIDVPFLETLTAQLTEEASGILVELESEFGLSEEIINSPMKLGQALIEMGVPLHKTTDKGRLTVAQPVLWHLEDDYPVVSKVLQWRKLLKMRDTFVKGLLRGQRNGILLPTFNQTVTATGRLSSSNPNMQNLPHVGPVRKGIIAQDGYSIVSIDYDQIDLRGAAYLSQDERMLRAFREGIKIHTQTADRLFGRHDPDYYYIGKQVDFAIIFGGQEAALKHMDRSKGIITDELARQAVDGLADLYPGYNAWGERTKEQALKDGYVENIYGRRRYIPKLYSRIYLKKLEALREAVNTPIQGTSAEIIKLGNIAVADVWLPFLQIHDELDFAIPNDRLDEIIPELCEAMTGVDCPFELKVDVEVGPSLGELEEWHGSSTE